MVNLLGKATPALSNKKTINQIDMLNFVKIFILISMS